MRDVIYHDRPRKTPMEKAIRFTAIGTALSVLTAALSILFVNVDRSTREQARTSLHQNVVQAMVQCYAIEGNCPADIGYLEANYGVRYDGGKFRVTLDRQKEGMLPVVTVSWK